MDWTLFELLSTEKALLWYEVPCLLKKTTWKEVDGACIDKDKMYLAFCKPIWHRTLTGSSNWIGNPRQRRPSLPFQRKWSWLIIPQRLAVIQSDGGVVLAPYLVQTGFSVPSAWAFDRADAWFAWFPLILTRTNCVNWAIMPHYITLFALVHLNWCGFLWLALVLFVLISWQIYIEWVHGEGCGTAHTGLNPQPSVIPLNLWIVLTNTQLEEEAKVPYV